MSTPITRPALLLLDFDDVLADFDPRQRDHVLAQTLAVPPAQVTAAIARARQIAATGGDAEPLQALLAHLQEQLQHAITPAQWHQARMAATSVRSQCRQLLLGLANDCPLAILSNNPAALAQPIATALDLPGLPAQRVLTAGALGLRKPDPACFLAALQQLGAAPQQTLFIDNLFGNVRGARAAGLMADTAHHAQSLRKVLKRHHLLR